MSEKRDKKIVSFIVTILSFLLVFFIFGLVAVRAQSLLQYPISELGYCRDAKECYLYCEIPENKATCWSYGKYILGAKVLGEEDEADEEIEAKALSLGITFPIAELGNCADVSECRVYCERPENHDACMAFARRYAIGQYEKYGSILDRAKEVLGCDSFESCRALCEEPANREVCMDFAEAHAPEEFRQRKDEMLARAREVLGCDSFASCQAFCENPENQETCMRFAEQYTPEEYHRYREEAKERIREYDLPCDSIESCREFCRLNPEQCREFAEPGGATNIEIRREESFTCKTKEECRLWCQENPDRCPGFEESADYQQYTPPEFEKEYQSEFESPPLREFSF